MKSKILNSYLIKSKRKYKCSYCFFTEGKIEKVNQILVVLITYKEQVARGLKKIEEWRWR